MAAHIRSKHDTGAGMRMGPRPTVKPKKLGENGAGRRVVTQPFKPAPGKAKAWKNGTGTSTNNRLSRLLPAELGTTEAGKAWALKCLHPNSESTMGSQGIPDTSSYQIALPEARSNLVISKPAGLADKNWDVVVMFPDCVEIACIAYYRTSGQTWQQVRDGLNATPPTAGFAAPQIFYNSLFKDTTMHNDADKWRITSHGATTHLDTAALTDQGMVYADHWPHEDFTAMQAAAEGPPVLTEYNAFLYVMPNMQSSDMVERSPRTYVNNARYGSYTVMYPSDTTLSAPYFSNRGTEKVKSIQFLWPDQSTSVTTPELYTKPAYTGLMTAEGRFDLGGFTTGFVLYEGIDKVSNVQVKVKTAFEIVPTNQTIAQAFTNRSPLCDLKALEVVGRVAQNAPGSYPADYNDLSKVLGSIWNTVKGVVGPASVVADFVSGLGIPMVSDGARIARNVMEVIGVL
jgi:hypothetical protein